MLDVNRHRQVVSHFDNGSNVKGYTQPRARQRPVLRGLTTVISGTGTPPDADPFKKKAGCPDNRVIMVNRARRIV